MNLPREFQDFSYNFNQKEYKTIGQYYNHINELNFPVKMVSSFFKLLIK